MNPSFFDIFEWVWSTLRTRCALLFFDIYRPQGKVIFPAEVSVSHSVHRVGLHPGGFASRRGLYPGICLQGVCRGGGGVFCIQEEVSILGVCIGGCGQNSPSPIMTSSGGHCSGGHCSGRHASNWNAFLLHRSVDHSVDAVCLTSL